MDWRGYFATREKMNKQQIKAELRRSACEDRFPLWLIKDDAFIEASYFIRLDRAEFVSFLCEDDQRTFFLLVAEAL